MTRRRNIANTSSKSIIHISGGIAFPAILTSFLKVPGALSEERHYWENINRQSPTNWQKPRLGLKRFAAHRKGRPIHCLLPAFEFSVFPPASSGRPWEV